MSAMAALAEARLVSRRFGAFTAVQETSLAVGRGEIVGLLGANGAGKTTLIRLLLGLLRPSTGAVELFGSQPSIAARRRVGYVPQTLGLYSGLTVAENWAFTAAAFRMSGAALPAAIAGLGGELVGSLPLGVQRQVAFAVATGHRPELLVLDEPTSGVGPLGGARLWESIRQAADHGAGTLVTTHNLEEAEQCDRLVVMADGKVVAAGTAAEITAGRTAAEIRCADPARAFAVLDAGGISVQASGSALRAAAPAASVAGLLSEAEIDAKVSAMPASLEEAFVAIITGPMTT